VWIFEQDIPDQVFDRGVETLKVKREVNRQSTLCHLRTKLFRASSKVEEIFELELTQEADTRLLLHMLHAAGDGYKAAVICPEDVDLASIAPWISPSTRTLEPRLSRRCRQDREKSRAECLRQPDWPACIHWM